MDNIYILADKALGVMVKDPLKGYSKDDLVRLINCTEEEAKFVFAILRSRGYVSTPKSNPIAYVSKEFYLKNEGGDFFLSGGFSEQIKKEKLMRENIESSIRISQVTEKSIKFQKIISVFTLLVLIIQVAVTIFIFKNREVTTKPLVPGLTIIENRQDTISSDVTVKPDANNLFE